MKLKNIFFLILVFFWTSINAFTIDSISLKMGTDTDLCSEVTPYGLPYSGSNTFDKKKSIETTIEYSKSDRNLFKKIKKISKKIKNEHNKIPFSEYSLNILKLTIYHSNSMVEEFSFNSHILINTKEKFYYSKDIIQIFLLLRKRLNMNCQFDRASELSNWHKELGQAEEIQENFPGYNCPSCPDCDYHIIKFDDSDFHPQNKCPYIKTIFESYKKKKALKICREFLLLSKINS